MANTRCNTMTWGLAKGSRRQVLSGLMTSAGVALASVALGDPMGVGAAKGGKDKTGSTSGKGSSKGKGNGSTNAVKPKARGFSIEANGSVATSAAPGCQMGGQCTTTFAGTGTADHLGEMTFTSSLTADWSQASQKSETGGWCAPIVGTSTATATSNSKNGKGSLTLAITGTVCETEPGAGGYPLELDGVYTITGGIGRFAQSTGTGTVGGTMAGGEAGDEVSFSATGKIVD